MNVLSFNFNIESYKPCLICGEPTRLTESEIASLMYGEKIDAKVCDKCKEAILYVRKQMKEASKE